MSQKTVTTLVDDLDGSTEGVSTVEFGLDGVNYAIDLSPANRRRLDQALGLVVEKARRAPRGPRIRTGGRSAPALPGTAAKDKEKERNQAMRDWARGQNIPIAERGRVPIEVRLRYQVAHPSGMA
jgi:hypothetical protein